jgi:polysaccharide biosynthesis transport protein
MHDEDKDTFVGGVDLDLFKVDLKVLFITFKRRLVFLLIIPILTFLACTLYLRYGVPKVWPAKCILFRQTNIEKLSEDLPNLYKPLNMTAVMEMIRSRQNVKEVINQLGLSMSINQFYRQTEVIKERDNNNMINLVAYDSDKKKAVKIANTLAEVFLKNYLAMQNKTGNDIYGKYRTQYTESMADIEQLEKKLTKLMKERDVINVESETNSRFKQLSYYELELSRARMKLQALNVKQENLKKNIAGMPEKVEKEYVIAGTDDQRIEGMKLQLNNLRQRYTENNPKVRAYKAELDFIIEKVKREKNETKTPEKITYGINSIKSELKKQVLKNESEMKGTEANIKQYETEIKKVKSDLNALLKAEGSYVTIKRQLDMKRELIARISKVVSVLDLALNASICDIVIYEKAEKASLPVRQKKKLQLLGSIILGFAISFGVVMMLELADFNVKSTFDLKFILKLNPLGMLPQRNDTKDKNHQYFSAFQVVFKKLTELAEPVETPLITVSSVSDGTGKSFIIEEFDNLLNVLGKNVLYIKTIEGLPEEESEARRISRAAVNSVVYMDDRLEITLPENSPDRMYFILDESTFRIPLKKQMVRKFLNAAKGRFDYIFWETMRFDINEQLFGTLCSEADINLIVASFRRSNKFKLLSWVNFLRDERCRNICGVLNNVDMKYYVQL